MNTLLNHFHLLSLMVFGGAAQNGPLPRRRNSSQETLERKGMIPGLGAKEDARSFRKKQRCGSNLPSSYLSVLGIGVSLRPKALSADSGLCVNVLKVRLEVGDRGLHSL